MSDTFVRTLEPNTGLALRGRVAGFAFLPALQLFLHASELFSATCFDALLFFALEAGVVFLFGLLPGLSGRGWCVGRARAVLAMFGLLAFVFALAVAVFVGGDAAGRRPATGLALATAAVLLI